MKLEGLHFPVLKRAVLDLGGEPEVYRVMIAESPIESLLSGSQTSQKNGLYLFVSAALSTHSSLWTGKFLCNFSFYDLTNK